MDARGAGQVNWLLKSAQDIGLGDAITGEDFEQAVEEPGQTEIGDPALFGRAAGTLAIINELLNQDELVEVARRVPGAKEQFENLATEMREDMVRAQSPEFIESFNNVTQVQPAWFKDEHFNVYFNELSAFVQDNDLLLAQEEAARAVVDPAIFAEVRNRFQALNEQMTQELMQQRFPAYAPIGAAAKSWIVKAQGLPSTPSAPAEGQTVAPSPLAAEKYNSLQQLSDELARMGPFPETYNKILEQVDDADQDSAKSAMAAFFQGLPEGLCTLYSILVKSGMAEPIDSGIVENIMAQHPELQEKDQNGKEAKVSYDGLFLPSSDHGLRNMQKSAAWEWSHTQEAYQNVYNNIMALPKEELEVVFAEIKAKADPAMVEGGFDSNAYEEALAQASALPQDVLADAVWQFASEQRTSDNGGWNAWICPSGCHTVPFDAAGQGAEEETAGGMVPMASSCNGCKLSKTASGGIGGPSPAYYTHGPGENRYCPKLRNVVNTYVCRYHCLDGLPIDDHQIICGEALWRQNVMDKYSREYRDKDGNWVGGYINKRFEVERATHEHPYQLKPGQRHAPINEDAWSWEKRLQEMRREEGEAREYSETPGDPKGLYNWDSYEFHGGPKNPQLFEKDKDALAKISAKRSLLEKTAQVDLMRSKQCKHCQMYVGDNDKVCPNCNGMDFVSRDAMHHQTETGNIPAPKDKIPPMIPDGRSDRKNLLASYANGVYCVAYGGRNFFGDSLKEAQQKARSLTDLERQTPSTEEVSNELSNEIQKPQGPSWAPVQRAQPPAAPVQAPSPQQVSEMVTGDPTPSTDAEPQVKPVVQIQGGESLFPQQEQAQPIVSSEPQIETTPEGETKVTNYLDRLDDSFQSRASEEEKTEVSQSADKTGLGPDPRG